MLPRDNQVFDPAAVTASSFRQALRRQIYAANASPADPGRDPLTAHRARIPDLRFCRVRDDRRAHGPATPSRSVPRVRRRADIAYMRGQWLPFPRLPTIPASIDTFAGRPRGDARRHAAQTRALRLALRARADLRRADLCGARPHGTSPSCSRSPCPIAFKWATDAVTARIAAARPWRSKSSRTATNVLRPRCSALLALVMPSTACCAFCHGARHAGARRALRRRGDERRAPPGAGGLRPPPQPVAALPSRAQDRRPHPRARARPQRDRDDRAHHHAHRRADGDRVRADPRRALRAVRHRLCRRRAGHDRGLSRLHLPRDELADVDPPLDERIRHRRQHQGDRLAAQLRDGEVLRRRGARGGAL